MQTDERIEALERRITVLEAIVQAQLKVSISPEEVANATVKELNRRMREGGNTVLLCC